MLAKNVGEHKPIRSVRCGVYARFSSEMQSEISNEDQIARCGEEIRRRGWQLAGVFTDSAKSGWDPSRPGFQDMLLAAEQGMFDCVISWKNDRMGRNLEEIAVVKALLRREYGLKLFCVEGVSRDDDDTPYTTLAEQILDLFASFYSLNLSSDTRRAKKSRAERGLYNGSRPPIGYRLVTKVQSSPDRPAGLYIDPETAPIITAVFERYATNEYSDLMIAEWMNEQPIIQESRKGEKPVGRGMVRDMLQNRTYTGRVGHAETMYVGGVLGQRKASSRGKRSWIPGKHEAIISDELFDTCQTIRAQRKSTRRPTSQMRTYALPDRVFCGHCIARGSAENLSDENFGKMRIQWQSCKNAAIYRCHARDRGYGCCEQSIIYEETILDSVVETLSQLRLPDNIKGRIDGLIRSDPAHRERLEKIADLEKQKTLLRQRCLYAEMPQDEYGEMTTQLDREIVSLRPLEDVRYRAAADLIEHFVSYWEQCTDLDNPAEARQHLLSAMVDRVFVYDDRVVAVALQPNLAALLEIQPTPPFAAVTEIVKA